MESKIIALILCGISVVLGVALYKIGKKDSFSLAPFCGARMDGEKHE